MVDPIGAFDRIRDLYLTYLDTAFRIGDDEIAERRRELLTAPGTLCTEPLLEPIPRYLSSGFRIDQLATPDRSDGRLPGFSSSDREAFAALALSGLLDAAPRPSAEAGVGRGTFEIFSHQAEMLRRGSSTGTPGIVTSGTGSGKTEAFLLPVLAMLAREACRWPRPSPEFLSSKWWVDPATGEPYDAWTSVPGRPGRRNPSVTPFRYHRLGEPTERPRAVRALILYPMNALVEDQMVRLRRALNSDDAISTMDRYFHGNRIFFGRYTSATPVTGFHTHPRLSARAYLQKRSRSLQRLFREMKCMDLTQRECRRRAASSVEDQDLPFNFPSVDRGELVNRWDIQGTPPDILITNTSMLNAMLVREVEQPVFDKTRRWIEADPDAYFFLVLDELHLCRGAAGTEVAYLLRLLIRRLGLDQPGNRHKLRILGSSASLPTEGEGAERSLTYLWDFFGSNGMVIPEQSANTVTRECWRDAIVPGIQEPPSVTVPLPLDPTPFVAFAASCCAVDRLLAPSDPRDHADEWGLVAAALGVPSDAPLDLHTRVRHAIERAAAAVTVACRDTATGEIRATALRQLSANLFGAPPRDTHEALRGLLIVRGCAELFPRWWPDLPRPESPSFRLHTFFRSIEGLFAAPRVPQATVSDAGRNQALFGRLTVERGLRFGDSAEGHPSSRFLEILYCECCGALFFGGVPGSHQVDGAILELLPTDPRLEELPERASTRLFEELSADDFRIFWPSPEQQPRAGAPRNGFTASPGGWRRAALDPVTARLRVLGPTTQAGGNGIRGWLYHPGSESDWPDRKGRSRTDAGTCVPYECPSCGTSYQRRDRRHRLSPIRNFRTGFAKTTQLLATEVFSSLKATRTEPKLVCPIAGKTQPELRWISRGGTMRMFVVTC